MSTKSRSAVIACKVFAIGSLLCCSLVCAAQQSKLPIVAAKAKKMDSIKLAASMSRLPLAFEANSGQTDPSVKFLSRGAGYTLFLTQDEAVLALVSGKNSPEVVRVKLAGSNGTAQVDAVERLGWNSNYFIGNDPKKWRTQVANYRKVRFDDVYPGVALVYYGNQQKLEHDFVVAPGADPKTIAMEIAGAKSLMVDTAGNLVIKTKGGELRFEKPVVYQDVDGARKEVAGNFKLRGKNKVGFEVASYDRSKALVIDPVLNYSTYLSGTTGANGESIALDAGLNAYITGQTSDISFPPASATALLSGGTVSAGTQNGFVAKLNPTGTTLLYNTFFGGNNTASGRGITVDGAGNAFVAGITFATDFPTLGAFQSGPLPVGSQGFVTEIGPAGSSLVYGSYLGGSGGKLTDVHGVSVNGGLLYLTGSTQDSVFPVSVGAFQKTISGTQSAFLTVLDPTIAGAGGLVYSSYLGGSVFDGGERIVASASAGVYLAGNTNSANFPVSPGAAITVAPGGSDDGFVAKFDTTKALVGSLAGDATCAAGVISLNTAANTFLVGEKVVVNGVPAGAGGTVFSPASPVTLTAVTGTSVKYNTADVNCAVADNSIGGGTVFGGLIYSTYLGGSGNDVIYSLALDSAGNAYVTGFTNSTNFPTVGPLQAALGAGATQNAFVTKINPGGTAFVYSTYLGGGGTDVGGAIVVDPAAGTAWVAGSTTSANFPVVNALQTSLAGTQNGFVARINAAGNALDYSTYLGGSGTDSINGMALDTTAPGVVYLAGSTTSTNFPVTGSAFQSAPLAASAAFVAKLTGTTVSLATPLSLVAAAPTVDPIGVSPQTGAIVTDPTTVYNFTIKNTDVAKVATAAHFEFVIPGGATPQLTVTIATPSVGTCTIGLGGVSCDLGTLNKSGLAGDTVTVAITASASQAGGCFTGSVCTASTIVSAAKASSAEGNSAASTTVTSNVKPVTGLTVSLIGLGNVSATTDKLVEQQDTALSYIATVKNTGDNTATGIDITFTVPAFFALTSSTPAGCTQGGGVGTAVSCIGIIPSLAGGSSTTTVTITGSLPPALAAGTKSLALAAAQAKIATTSIIDPVPANHTSISDIVTQERDTALSITLADNGPATPGGALQYTASILNGGPSDATNVKVTVPVDPSFTVVGVVSATMTCTGAGVNPVVCTQSPILNGGSASITINTTTPAVLTPPVVINAAAGSVSRTAGVVTVTISGGHPFVIGQTVEVARVTYAGVQDFNGQFVVTGTTATTFTYAQAGPDDATGAGGTAFTPGPQAIAAGAGSAIRVSGISKITTSTTNGFAAGQTVNVAGVVSGTSFNGQFVIQSIVSPTQFTYLQSLPDDAAGAGGTATIFPGSQIFATTATLDSNPTGTSDNNTPPLPLTSTTDTIVQNKTDLAIGPVFTPTGSIVPLAGPLAYSLQVTNTGAIAPNTTVRFTLTTGTAITADAIVNSSGVANSCIANPHVGSTETIDCLIDSLPTGTSTVTLSIVPPVSTTISSGTTNSDSLATSATISSDFVVDSAPGNETTDGTAGRAAAVSNTIQRTADLDISAAGTGVPLAGAPGTVALAGPLTYTYTIKNSGPDAALNVLSTLQLTSTGVTTPLVVGTPIGATCVLNAGNIDCTVASVASGASVAISVPITPPVLTSMTGPTAVATDTLSAIANLGTQVSTVDSSAGNNTNGTTVTTTLRRTSDLDISTPTFNATGSTASYAGGVTATTVITNLTGAMKLNFGLNNNGPDAALNAKVTLTNVVSGGGSAPSSITSTPGSTCSASGNNIQCSVDAVPTTGTTSIVVSFTPSTPAPMTLVGGASPTGSFTSAAALNIAQPSYVDGNSVNDTNGTTVTTNLQRQSNLQLNFAGASFTGAPSMVSLSGPLTYTANINNLGPDPALKIKGRFTLSTGAVTTPFAFLAASSTYDIGAGPVILAAAATNGCTSPSSSLLDCEVDGSDASPIPLGISPGFVINVTPPLTTAMNGGLASDALTTSAFLGSLSVVDNGPGGSFGADNTSPTTVGTTIQRQADIQVTGLSAASDVTGGALFVLGVDTKLTYTVTVANNGGPDSAKKMDVTAAVPAGFTLTGPVGCSQAGGPGTAITCLNAIPGPLAPAATATFSFQGTPASPGTSVPEIADSMSVSVNSTAVIDSNPANNSASVNATIRRKADVSVTSITAAGNNSGTPNKFVDTVDTAINYTVNLANSTGNSTATDINLNIAVPAGISLSSGVGCTQAGGVGTPVTCALAVATITSPGTASFNFALSPSALSSSTGSLGLVVQVTATGGYIDPNGLNNTNVASPSVNQERVADVSITSITANGNIAGLSGKFVETVDTQMNYTVSLANAASNSTATNIDIAIAVPAGATLFSGAGCTQAAPGAVITCTTAIASIASPGTGGIAFALTPAAMSSATTSQPFAIAVTATGAYTDPTPANNTNFANSISQERDAEVSITSISAIGNSAGAVANKFFETVDSQINYTVNLSNSAAANTSTATNVNIATTVPAGATLVPQAGCSQVGAVITCSNAVPSILSGASGSFTFAVTPAPLAAGTTTLAFNANMSVSGAYNDATPDTSAAPSVSQERDADISITTAGITGTGDVEGTPGKFIENVDTKLLYTVNVANSSAAGISTATDITLTTPSLPSLAVLVPQAGCAQGGAGTPITCTNAIASLAPGASAAFSFAVTLPPMAASTTSQPLNLNVTATGAFNDAIPANNTNIAATTVTEERDADVAISSIASSGSVLAVAGKFVETVDGQINYTVNLANSNDVNTSTATNLQLVVDGLPAGATLSSGAGCTQGGGPGTKITCTNIVPAGLPKGAAVPFSFAITPLALLSSQTSQAFNLSFSVTGSYNDPNPANSTAIPNSLLQERDAEVAIGVITAAGNISALPNKFIDTQDSSIAYTVPLTNASGVGISAATNLNVKVVVPAGASLIAQAGCIQAGAGAVINCAVPAMPAGTAQIFTVGIAPQPLSAGTASQSFNASFTVSGSYVDSTSADDTNIPAPTVDQERDADLGVTLALDAAQVQPVIVGPSFNQTITYVATVTNTAIVGVADSTATNVQVKDVLPTGLTFDSAATTAANGSAACSLVTGAVVCNFGSVAVGAVPTLKIVLDAGPTALPVSAASGIIPNLVTVGSGSILDPSSTNNQSNIVDTNLIGEADISVINTAMTASPNPVLVGNDVTYTITVDNNAGPHPSQSLKFNDTLPTGVSLVSASSTSFNCAGGVLPCTLNSLPAGTSATITVVGHVNAAAIPGLGLSQVLANTATITSNGTPVTLEDPLAANNTAVLNNPTAQAAADLVASQTSPAPVLFGNPIHFAVSVRNDNVPVRSTATGIVVKSTVTVVPAISTNSVTGMSAGCSFTPFTAGGVTTITCPVANLASNASATVNFIVTPSVPGNVTNSSTVDPRTNPPVQVDTIPGNDSAPAVTVTVDNTPVCAPGTCAPVVPLTPTGLPGAGLSPLTPPQAMLVTFTGGVTGQGTTTLTTAPCSTANTPIVGGIFNGTIPLGTRAGTYVCGTGAPTALIYTLGTSAVSPGPAQVCVNYSGDSFHKPERVRLVQLFGSVATDITIAAGFTANSVCGSLSSLAAGTTTNLAVMEPSNAAPDGSSATAVASSGGSGKGAAGNAVVLDATGTTDVDHPDGCVIGGIASSCGDTLTYTWTSTGFLGATTVSGAGPLTVSISGGTISILLTVKDQLGATFTKTFTVTTSGTTTVSGSSVSFNPVTINKGQTGNFTTQVDSGASVSGVFSIVEASSLAANQISCSISPTTVPANGTNQNVTILCSTQGQIFGKLSAPDRGIGTEEAPMLAGLLGLSTLPLLGMMLMPGKARRRKLLRIWAAMGLLLLVVAFQAACGGGGGSSFGGAPVLKNAGTPSGNYTVTLALPTGVTPSSVANPATPPVPATVLAPTKFTLTVQ